MASMGTGAHTAGMSQGTRIAMGFAAATLVVWLVLVLTDHEGGGWLAYGALALGTVITGVRAGGAKAGNRLATAALVLGAVALISFLGFVISDL